MVSAESLLWCGSGRQSTFYPPSVFSVLRILLPLGLGGSLRAGSSSVRGPDSPETPLGGSSHIGESLGFEGNHFG